MVLDNPFESDMRVEKEINSLLTAGIKVSLFCQIKEGLEEKEVLDNGLTIHRHFDNFFQHPLRREYRHLVAKTANAILQEDPTHVHCHDFFTLEIGAQVKSRAPRVKLTYDSHEYFLKWKFYNDIPNRINRLKGWLNWKYLIYREKVNSRKADLVISTTNAICDAIRYNYSLKVPTIALRNIPTIRPSGKNLKLRDILSLNADQKILVQSGNIYQSDELLQTMFDTIVRIPNLVFVLIGNRPRFYEVKSWVEQNAKWNNCVRFVEYNSAYLHDYLSSADMGLLYMKTHIWESHLMTSPNRVMEYSLCGIPFVSVNQVTSIELKNEFGHVEIFDAQIDGDFFRALKSMISDLESYSHRAKNVAHTLSWDQEFEPVLSFYTS